MSLAGAVGLIAEFALDAISLRQQFVSENIANTGTVGYRPKSLTFQSQIEALSRINDNEISNVALRNDSWSVLSPEIHYGKPVVSAQDSTGLAEQVIELNKNALQYQALIRAFDKYMSPISIAVNDGRRT